MATTRGWELRGDIANAINYILDLSNKFAKTEYNLYVASNESELGGELGIPYKWKKERLMNRADAQNVGYHFQFSLPKGEGTPEDCLIMAEEWINKISDNKAKYIIAVHTNTNCIHAHIICDSYLIDNKQWHIFWAKDKYNFRTVADSICKEHGYSTLDNPWDKVPGKTRSYYEYADNSRDILKKVLDYTIQRVKTYDDMKTYLESLGYKFYDKKSPVDTNTFNFTADIKLIREQDDGTYLVRVPYQKYYIRVENDCFEWLKENKTARIMLPIDKDVNILDKYEFYQKTVKAAKLKNNFEEKQKNKNDYLKIRMPGTKRVIHTRKISKDENNIGYSLDDIILRIKDNGRFVNSPEIQDVINNQDDYETIQRAKSLMYEKADIRIEATSDTLFRSKRQESYFRWKADQLQKRMDKNNYSILLQKDRENISLMKGRLSELQLQLDDVNKTLKEFDVDIENIIGLRMEGVLSISNKEIDKYISETKIPLIDKKETLKQMIELYSQRINSVEKDKISQRRTIYRNERIR